MTPRYLVPVLVPALLLAACNSGGKSGTSPANTAATSEDPTSSPPGAMEAMGDMSAASGAMTGTGSGVVTALDKSAGTITLKHGPIPGVHWPAMTMAFKAVPSSLVDEVAVGDKISFDVRVDGPSNEVTAIRKQ